MSVTINATGVKPPLPRQPGSFLIRSNKKQQKQMSYKIHKTKDMLFSTQNNFQRQATQTYSQSLIAQVMLRKTTVSFSNNGSGSIGQSGQSPIRMNTRSGPNQGYESADKAINKEAPKIQINGNVGSPKDNKKTSNLLKSPHNLSPLAFKRTGMSFTATTQQSPDREDKDTLKNNLNQSQGRKNITSSTNFKPFNSTFMISTVTNKIKQLIKTEEIKRLRKEQTRLNSRSQQQIQIDKLMRMKDELEQKGKMISNKKPQLLHSMDKPRQVRFGSVAYIIQRPRDNSMNDHSDKDSKTQNRKCNTPQGQQQQFLSSLSQLSLDSNMRTDFNKLSRKDIPHDALNKFKWKTIQYLLETKKQQIDLLTRDLKSLMQEVKEETRGRKQLAQKKLQLISKFYGTHTKVYQDHQKKCELGNDQEEECDGLNREEFGRLLEKVGLGHDKILIDKIFWIFDEDGSGDIDHKELGVGLELLKNNTFEEKLDKFFDLCDEDNSGTIDKKEFYTLLRLNVTDYEDRNRLKTYVNEIFQQFDKSGQGELTKEEMKDACSSNQKIKNLIEKNVKILKDIDNWIESDFARPFTTKISFCAGLSINSRNNAVYYPSIRKFLSAFEKKEEIYQNVKSLVSNYDKQKKFSIIQEENPAEQEQTIVQNIEQIPTNTNRYKRLGIQKQLQLDIQRQTNQVAFDV